MGTIATRCCAALVLGLGLVGLVAPAAQAYPATVCSASVTPRHATGGKSITVRAKANKPVDWTVELKVTGAGTRTARGHGKTFVHVFATVAVSSRIAYNVDVACSGGGIQHYNRVLAPAASNTGHSVNADHNVNAGHTSGGAHRGSGNQAGPGSSGSGLLPNTGGPALWLALLGAGLLAGGAVTLGRRLRG